MNLDNMREQLNDIDSNLVQLFCKRMNIAKDIAKYKSENNLPIFHRDREREIFERMTEMSGEELAIYTKVLYSTLFDLSRSYQHAHVEYGKDLIAKINDAVANTDAVFPKQAVVACQGVEGSYSQQACDKLFAVPSIMYMGSFESVFRAVASGMCRYGVLPIENSSYGSVTEVYDLMKRNSFNIVRSVKLKVDHELLAASGVALGDITEIFSHEQAIGQCSEFLESLKGVKVTAVENTAVAAKMVSESGRKDVAAISSGRCASLYGLHTIKSDVQNTQNNYTRFICISKNPEIYPGAKKISLMLSLSHNPGSLYRVVAHFAALGINLTKLQSRPMPGSDFEFMFYFDIDAGVADPEVGPLLSALEQACDQFVFLGNYDEI